ncbi:MAG: class I SAM-dependent methyltransferase [bacterium]|nr:class I SAM-dependent methyltransferase [bacterium]
MTYRGTQQESRQRYLDGYDVAGALKYDSWVASLTPVDHDACVADLKQCVQFRDAMDVLDAGSGTGALCLALVRIPGLRITALEPCAAMSDLLVSKPELESIATVRGFCDHVDDANHFHPNSFDLIASRQLANCLFDPLAAFRNWFYWLRPGGTVVVMDGLFDRDAWSGTWDGMVDTLPLSACRTMATVPYLLEQVGFHVDHAGPMSHTNALPSTQTRRYIVAASKCVAS